MAVPHRYYDSCVVCTYIINLKDYLYVYINNSPFPVSSGNGSGEF